MRPRRNTRGDVADPVTGTVRVLAGMCATCIFRPGNPMSLTAGRLRQLIADARDQEGHIVCHSTLSHGPHPDAAAAICRGYADRYGQDSLALRYGHTTGSIVEVDPPGKDTP